MKYDVFICHASEDKDDFVRPLAEKLSSQQIHVWYDEFSLSIGDSLMQKIDEGLKNSTFGIVVLSPHFFSKPWAKRELSGLTAREMYENRSVILPIWHRVGISEVMAFSPALADKRAASSADGINSVLREIANKVKPNESPLLIAQQVLSEYGIKTPSISDEWWFDVIEYKQFLKYPDLNVGSRWIFPLPYPKDERGFQRGQNIASTVLQTDWSFEGEELDISPITHPGAVHQYLNRWPGLVECARRNPEILALYAPQITIPGFDGGFEQEFDKLMEPGNKSADQIFTDGSHEIMDGKAGLCGDVIAFRHPDFGNYTPRQLARWYFTAHNGAYVRSHLNVFEGLVWLLSDDAGWMPQKHRDTLIEGILSDTLWVPGAQKIDSENRFIRTLIEKRPVKFKLTTKVMTSLEGLIARTIERLHIEQSTEKVTDRLMALDFTTRYYRSKEAGR